jgi:hypothetical protein
MSGLTFWLQNGIARSTPPPHVLIDCGYADHEAACTAIQTLVRVFGRTHRRRRNAELVGSNRLLFRVPPDKVADLLSLPDVAVGGQYCWTTHTFGTGPQFLLPSQRGAAEPVAKDSEAR